MNIVDVLTVAGILKHGKYITSPCKIKRDLITKLGREANIVSTDSLASIVFCLIHGLHGGKCLHCGSTTKFKSFSRGFNQFCSKKCAHSSDNTHNKRKQTVLDKYGVNSVLQLKSVRNAQKEHYEEFKDVIDIKRRNTNIAKFGGPAPICDRTIKAAIQQTILTKYGVTNAYQKQSVKAKVLKKYGVDHISKSSEIRNKIKQTNLSKYGVEFPLQLEAIRDKAKETNIQLTGFSNPFSFLAHNISATKKTNYVNDGLKHKLQKIKENNDVTLLCPLDEYDGGKKSYNWLHNTCGHKFSHILFGIKEHLPCPKCHVVSRPELELLEFIHSLGYTDAIKTRKIIAPYEIDIFIPELNIGFELNGCFWHGISSRNVPKTSLSEKTTLANFKNVRLIHIWDIEWQLKREQVKSRIMSILQKNPVKYFARRLDIKAVNNNIAYDFLDANHMQGRAKSSYNLGLYNGDELLSLMTFGKSRFNKAADFELIRFCTLAGSTVVGGGQKLFSTFSKSIFGKSIMTYSDNNWSDGTFYELLGFEHIKNTAPGYFWTRGNTILSRYETMNIKLPNLLGEKYDNSLSEDENMWKSGWIKCYNSGNKVFWSKNGQ